MVILHVTLRKRRIALSPTTVVLDHNLLHFDLDEIKYDYGYAIAVHSSICEACTVC